MNQGRIIVITGVPGTGKATAASAAAKELDLKKSVRMHIDNFYHYLSKGVILPHLLKSNKQNSIVIEAFLETAKRYARGGCDVIVDGITGPWLLKPWQSLIREHYGVHYVTLRVSKEETLKRTVKRSKLGRRTDVELIETMWEQFCNLRIYELGVVDTTNYSTQETVFAVQGKVASRVALLSQIVLVQFPFIEQMKLESHLEATMPKDKVGDIKAMNNEYDNEKFSEEHAKISRSKEGLKVVGEWHQLEPLFPSLKGKSILDLGRGCGWHCRFAEEQGAIKILGIDLSKKMTREAQERNSGN